jgi:hypothetical protein
MQLGDSSRSNRSNRSKSSRGLSGDGGLWRKIEKISEQFNKRARRTAWQN